MSRASKCPINLTENAFFVTTQDLQVKIQARLYAGNTRGNIIGPLAKPSLTDMKEVWHVRHELKKQIFGESNLPLPGGKVPQMEEEIPEDEEPQRAPKVRNSDLVPAFYHEAPNSVAFEAAHFLQASAILDLTPGSGHWALYALKYRVPYCGVVFTPKHQEQLEKKLASKVLIGMCDSHDVLYDPGFAKEIQQDAAGVGGEDPPPPKGRGKGRGGKGRGGKGRGDQNQGSGEGPGPAPPIESGDGGDGGDGGESRDSLLKAIAAAAAS